jgi:NTE family protein
MNYDNNCTNLVIGGAGSLIYSYIGALLELFNDNELLKIKNYIGTSAGSIVAMILACNATTDFLNKKALLIDLGNFQDNSWHSYMTNAYNIIRYFGYNKGDNAINCIESLLEELTGDKNITFKQHYEKFKKNLVITGYNLSKNKPCYFNRLSNPNMKISNAVRISISIPFVYCPFIYEGDLYIDGGIAINYPMNFIATDMFKLLNDYDEDIIGKNYERVDLESATKNINTTKADTLNSDFKEYILNKTIGIKTIENKETSRIIDKNLTITSYACAVLDVLLDNALKENVNDEMWDRSIRIDSSGYSFMNFNINDKTKQDMINLGRESAGVFKCSLLKIPSPLSIGSINDIFHNNLTINHSEGQKEFLSDAISNAVSEETVSGSGETVSDEKSIEQTEAEAGDQTDIAPDATSDMTADITPDTKSDDDMSEYWNNKNLTIIIDGPDELK